MRKKIVYCVNKDIEQISGCLGPKGERRLIVNRHKEPFWDDGSALKLDRGDCFATYKYIKTLELHIKIGEFHAT